MMKRLIAATAVLTLAAGTGIVSAAVVNGTTADQISGPLSIDWIHETKRITVADRIIRL